MTPLSEQIKETPVVGDADAAAGALSDLAARCRSDGLDALSQMLLEEGRPRQLMLGTMSASPYLSGLCLRDPEALWHCLSDAPEAYVKRLHDDLQVEMAAAASANEAMKTLRRIKNRFALLIGLVDIAGVWGVEQATRTLSEAADALVNGAVRFLLKGAAAKGQIEPEDPDAPEKGSGYIIIGMGKYGARELNYSSDVDLIVFYDRAHTNLKPDVEPGVFFVRITRELVRLLSERTADGYVFRTDLRLRPDPSSTQIALSTDAGFHYYESFGQNWERAAFIKARAVAGDVPAGERFLNELAPFVWRKYLDFAAIADVHAMKRQIHAFRGHARIAVSGHNLKLGRGGIREIEFFVQTQQLIAGGRQPELRCRQTLEALRILAERDWISENTALELADAYRFLRRTEHRVQMISDEQTHSLPSDENELLRVAQFCGFADITSFAECLKGYLRCVEGHYAALFEDVPELTAAKARGNLVFTGDSDDPETVRTLTEMGYKNPSSVIATVRGWHYGRYRSMRSEKTRERLTEFLPALLEALAQTAQPDFALATFDAFLAELPTGAQLFALLRNNPPLLKLIADIMGSAPRLAHILSRRRRVIDVVLDPGFIGDLPSASQLAGLVEQELAEASDYQDALDRARIVGQEQAFLVGVGLLSDAISSEQAAAGYTQLAETMIRALQAVVEADLKRAHGGFSHGQAAVIAMGKLGSREMTATSDLDLIVVYDFEEGAHQSDGPKPLAPQQYYARFAQRLIAALSAPTAQGKLYEVDMRLRPSGNAGPVAASLSSFIDYQHNRAWTWEHMALTRARVVSGPPALKEQIEKTIQDVLGKPRDAARIAADMREMRERIAREKGTDDVWDLKNVRGGLIDLEFTAQYLQLVHAHKAADVLDQNTLSALRKLADHGFVDAGNAEILIQAARLYHNVTHILRLCVEGRFVPADAPEGLKALIVRAGEEPDFAHLEAKLAEMEQAVAHVFDAIAGGNVSS